MKSYKLYFAAALAGLALASCVDLDTAPSGGTVTSKQKAEVVAENPEMASAGVNGIYSMFSIYQNANVGYTRHNDFGYPAVMLFLDSRGTDFVAEDTGYNWFSYGLNMLEDRSADGLVDENIWNTLYNQIFAANAVAASIDVATEDSNMQFYLAQALATRAFDYFNLVQIYAFNYKGHESSPSVPIITDANANQVAAEGAPRATVQAVYDQILSDINTAIDLLGKTSVKRSDKRYVDLSVALGLRARINLTMQNWSAAQADAEAAIAASSSKPLSMAGASVPGFKKMTEDDWMWGIYVAETDRVVTSGIVNWQSHMGSFNYGYAQVGSWKMVGKALFNQIPKSDVRRGWFLDGDGNSENLNDAQIAYIKKYKLPPYTQVKFAPYKDELGTSTNSNDIILMRIEEMYFIAAEAKAMSGDAAGAAADLQKFVSTYRDPEYTCTAKTATGVQDAVWLQRRIELWGEGISYFDIMRRGQGLNRVGYGFAPQFVFDIKGDDNILIFEIPEDECEANPQISQADNPLANEPVPVKE